NSSNETLPSPLRSAPWTNRTMSRSIRSFRVVAHPDKSRKALSALATPATGRMLSLQLDIPVEPVPPRLVEVVGREAVVVLLQLPVGRADRVDQLVHLRLRGRAPAFLHVARGAGGADVLPRRAPAEPARQHVVEGQVLLAAAVLALEAVAQEHVEA